MTLIIAEAGVNHNGNEDLALALVEAAYQAGADVVKFQTFIASNLVTPVAKQAEYQTKNTHRQESQLSMLQRLELSHATHHKLTEYCDELGIEFLSTAFDGDSLHFLASVLGLRRLKIPSGELTNAPFILDHARTGCDLILSTGMASLAEIEAALSVIAFGYLAESNSVPSTEGFMEAYTSSEGRECIKNRVTVLHCTTEYPAPVDEVNLRVMDTLSQAFDVNVGYSDHTSGIAIPIAAVARGARLIEKHFTLDRSMEGPDHRASLEPREFDAMVKSIREIEAALGSPVKMPTNSELKNREVARKSLVAAGPISQGDIFSKGNIAIKRPGSGVSPYLYWEYMGRRASRDYQAGDIIVD